ncbi:MAG: 2-oxoglutarate dehydrogenase E1 component [Zetaproteobacteria bacterium]|nr:2-oxoglutarate dehydrogenase E1 component [Zetaproteobacteria bacterium]
MVKSHQHSYLNQASSEYLEEMLEIYRHSPEQLEPTWKYFFDGFELAQSQMASEQSLAQTDRSMGNVRVSGHEHAGVEAFINLYRTLGHLCAHTSPLSLAPEIETKMLPAAHGLGDISAEAKFSPANFGRGNMTFTDIWSKLKQTYCGRIGADYRDIQNIEAVVWLQQQMEQVSNTPQFSVDKKMRMLKKLGQAEGLEKYLQNRYLGQKRFSLEGLDALIPLLDHILDDGSNMGIEEVNIGMAHRGRLNVLANIMEKPLEKILVEFEGSHANPFDIDGDVKYHMGYASEVKTASGGTVALFLCPNPSHLEAVNPVLEGFTRRRQEEIGEHGRKKIVPVLLHGDAAFIGQGIVAETLNLSKLGGYTTGGTIHIITNNQIGFTTNPFDSRSCFYSSDISKMVRAPVFHVNADDVEAVCWVGHLALEYRQRYGEDVVIDLIGYRRHGHNETDEPSFTQPQMYKLIKKQQTAFKKYGAQLVSAGVASAEQLKELELACKQRLQDAYARIHAPGYAGPQLPQPPQRYTDILSYAKPSRREVMSVPTTAITELEVKALAQQMLAIPDGFHANAKIMKLFETRRNMLEGAGSIDWGFGELLAFASLVAEGHRVRLSGQDCKRGTFSSRHGVIFDQESGTEHPYLRGIGKGDIDILNSPLSEQGCLGFEFGYSVACPGGLVIWEAQFGDFVNGAQIIIDQFLAASEAKWAQTSRLVLMLPHGFEGMGPEHSSARVERFLQLCGNLNMIVCNVTTPAQIFHLLRCQVKREVRKPLVLFTPKSLLRHPKVRSPLLDFTSMDFQPLFVQGEQQLLAKAGKIIFCSGKVYYELLEMRDQHQEYQDVPIVRLEQLYPFPFELLGEKVLAKMPHLKSVIWVQEEPQNMGYWSFVRPRLVALTENRAVVSYVGRKHSGTTAEGSPKAHQLEQQRILTEAFGSACAWAPGQNLNEQSTYRKL